MSGSAPPFWSQGDGPFRSPGVKLRMPTKTESTSPRNPLNLSLDQYIPLGSFHFQPTNASSKIINGEEGAWEELVEEPLPFPYDQFAIYSLVLRLFQAAWVRIFVHKNNANIEYATARVFLLPDDVALSSLPRDDRKLRTNLRSLMLSVDRSSEVWNGLTCNMETFSTYTSAVGDDDSLFYIFNTLESPNPTTDGIPDRFARKAIDDVLGDSLQTRGLKTQLYPYQKRSVAAIIQRESAPSTTLDPRLEAFDGPTGREFYFDRDAGRVLSGKRTFDQVKGGILAETMGYGKTLICLATILATKNTLPEIPPGHVLHVDSREASLGCRSLSGMVSSTIARHNIQWRHFFAEAAEEDGEHYDTVVQTLEENIGKYSIIREYTTRRGSRKEVQEIHALPSTLVVVPPNLLSQWKKEIEKHLEPDALAVLVVDGLDLPDAATLGSYDLVLMSRTRFEEEFTSPLRKPEHSQLCVCFKAKRSCRVHNYRSPLLNANFLRFIVDEGQGFVSGAVTRACSSLAALSVERKWIVSGTPTSEMIGAEVDLAALETDINTCAVDHNSLLGTDDALQQSLPLTAANGTASIQETLLKDQSEQDLNYALSVSTYDANGVTPHSLLLNTIDGASSSPDQETVPGQQEQSLPTVYSPFPSTVDSTARRSLCATTPEDLLSPIQKTLFKRQRKQDLEQERKDIQRLGLIVKDVLGVKPWAIGALDRDAANWNNRVVPHASGSRKPISLRHVLQNIVVRHRIEDVEADLQLPPLYNKTIRLRPSFTDKLSMNLFTLSLAANAITSERTDQDYIFHPSNRKSLEAIIRNMRSSAFFWTGFSEHDIFETCRVSRNYLDNREHSVSTEDRQLLEEAITIGQAALASSSWKAFSKTKEIGVYAERFPSSSWGLCPEDDMSPLLLGATQLEAARQLIEGTMYASDPLQPLVEKPAPAVGQAYMTVTNGKNTSPKKSESDGDATTNTGIPKSSVQDSLKLTSGQFSTHSTSKGNNRQQRTPKDRGSKASTKSAKDSILKSDPTARPPIPQSYSALSAPMLLGTSSVKLSYLLERIIDLQQDEKIIVFYEGDHIAYYLAQALEILSIPHLIYATGITLKLRTEYHNLFNTDDEHRVMLMDLKQAAHGLHLAVASRVFFINPVWQPNIEAQAIKRAHRIGQSKPVYVETLILQDTIEDKMFERRKNMTAQEQQKASKSLLDDTTMADLIKKMAIIPLTEDECEFAPLRTPQQIFARSVATQYTQEELDNFITAQKDHEGGNSKEFAVRFKDSAQPLNKRKVMFAGEADDDAEGTIHVTPSPTLPPKKKTRRKSKKVVTFDGTADSDSEGSEDTPLPIDLVGGPSGLPPFRTLSSANDGNFVDVLVAVDDQPPLETLAPDRTVRFENESDID